MTEELRQDIQRRVHAVQRHYHGAGPALRVVWLVVAFVVIVVGVAMTVLPGPAVIVVPVGLAMLAVRFRWAQWALRAVIEHGVRLQRRLAKASPLVKLASSAVTFVVVALLAVVVLR
jgi:tellurite resistance protein TerC